MKNNYTALRADRIFPKLRVAFSALVLLMFAATTAFAQTIWNDPITGTHPSSHDMTRLTQTQQICRESLAELPKMQTLLFRVLAEEAFSQVSIS